MLAIRALNIKSVTSTFNRLSCVYFSAAAGNNEHATSAPTVLDKYVNFDEISKNSQHVFFKASGLPEKPEELDENSIFDYLEEQDPSVNDVVLRTLFAYGRIKGNEDSFRIGMQYWQKYSEQIIPSVHEYNQYLLLLGASNHSNDAWKVFVEMDRDCARNSTSYVNFLMFHPFASLKDEQKKFIQQSFEADRKEEDQVTIPDEEADADEAEDELTPEEVKEIDPEENQLLDELDKDDWDFVKDDLMPGEFHKEWSPENALKLVKASPYYQSLTPEQQQQYNEELDNFEFPSYN
jgi:hypothetical protein